MERQVNLHWSKVELFKAVFRQIGGDDYLARKTLIVRKEMGISRQIIPVKFQFWNVYELLPKDLEFTDQIRRL